MTHAQRGIRKRRAPRTSRLTWLVLALVALASVGGKCASGAIRIHAPATGLLVDDPSLAFVTDVATTIDPATVAVEIDDVDLIAALGLTPPFLGAGGVVMIDGTPVTVSGFDYDPGAGGGRPPLDFVLTGMPDGQHLVRIHGLRISNGASEARARPWVQVPPFFEAAQTVPAGAEPGPVSRGPTSLYAGSLGDPLAGPPRVGAQSTLRPGFVAAARGLASP